ncbi:MAG: hydrogenase [Ardenticatenaceae bacterium]|nr:MAG: hydrogenase [Ardenticatenaceae bacterium]
MLKTVVIGIGNPLRGDDGVGWAVIEALEAESGAPITAVSAHQLLPEHIDLFRLEAQVIFVDASVEGTAGEVTVTAVPATKDGPAASHHLHPGVLLALGEKLYGRMPPAHLITISGQAFGYEEKLSLPAREAIAIVVNQIKQLAVVPTSP